MEVRGGRDCAGGPGVVVGGGEVGVDVGDGLVGCGEVLEGGV